MSTNGVQAVSISKHFVKSLCKHETVRKCRIQTNNENAKA